MRNQSELIGGFLDDELSQDEEKQLSGWLLADSEHLREFVRETHLHGQLRQSFIVKKGLVSSARMAPEDLREAAKSEDHYRRDRNEGNPTIRKYIQRLRYWWLAPALVTVSSVCLFDFWFKGRSEQQRIDAYLKEARHYAKRESTRDRLDGALTALEKRNFQRAEHLFREVLRLEPRNDQALHGVGDVLLYQGRLIEAEDHFRRLLAVNPTDGHAYFGLGEVQWGRRNLQEAERLYTRAIDLNPNIAHFYTALADVYRNESRDLVKAEGLIRKSISLAPNRPEPLNALAWVMVARDNLPEAEQLLRQGLRIEPRSFQLHNSLGEVLRLQGNLESAVEAYRKALEITPDHVFTLNNLAIVSAMRGDDAEAEKVFRKLLERAEVDPRINPLNFLINLAMVCDRQGKVDEAEQFFRKSIELSPEAPQAWNSLAWFLASRDRKLDEALSLSQRAVQKAPNDPTFLDSLGWILFKRGDLKQAEETLTEALRLAGQSPVAEEIATHLTTVKEAQRQK